jgi:hypothetical protein
MASFREELEVLINQHCMENGSDTPDFILAHYLSDCLEAFDKAVLWRENWYGREKENGKDLEMPTDTKPQDSIAD